MMKQDNSNNMRIRPILILFVTVLLWSCSNLRYLDEGEALYTGSRVNIDSQEPVKNKKEIETVVESVIRPRPNAKFLIWRPRLWFYNIAGTSGDGAIWNWIRNKLGRPPVLFTEESAERNVRLIQNRLFNLGHFDAVTGYNLREKSGRTAVEYNIYLRPPYLIRNISLAMDDSGIAEDINLSMEESIIKKGRAYRLEMLKKERERIDGYLKENGYFYFHPDFLIFRADSTADNRGVDLFLSIKPATPGEALMKFKTGNIYIESGTAGQRHEDAGSENFVEAENGIFVNPKEDVLKPRRLVNVIFLEKDSIYKNSDHRLTLNHLMGLGVFKFVNIRFEKSPKEGENIIDARVMLTPMEKKSISSELRWVSKSNSFSGPGLQGSFSNRNLLGGAENLTISAEGAYESILGSGGVNSTEVGLSSELSIPRLITPYKTGRSHPLFIPKTIMSLSFSFRNRTDAFSLSSIRSRFGYVWNPTGRIQHRYNPFVFNVFSLGAISDEYRQIFSKEALLRRGLFEQFLIGSEYTFVYNTQHSGDRKHDWYLHYNIDLSGNTAWLISSLSGSGTSDQESDRRIFNQSFSQYTKTDFDLRYFVNTGSRSRIAARLIAGIGLPYGNSETLPYARLFTIGGSNSIRAFHPRTLGPGSYSSPDTLVSTLNIFQSGEIKLEMNLEYRYDISRVFKAAVFADAGNIWNLREKENVPGGQLTRDGFARQIALGTGAGLRLDFTFFLLRLDLAFPLAIPSVDGSGYFEKIRPLDAEWRKDNLILNLAIGYPF